MLITIIAFAWLSLSLLTVLSVAAASHNDAFNFPARQSYQETSATADTERVLGMSARAESFPGDEVLPTSEGGFSPPITAQNAVAGDNLL